MSSRWSAFLNDYGIVLALLALVAFFSLATLQESAPTGADGGRAVAQEVIRRTQKGAGVLVVVRATEDDAAFAQAAQEALERSERVVLAVVRGAPSDARQTLDDLALRKTPLHAVAVEAAAADWPILQQIRQRYPILGAPPVIAPPTYRWPVFLQMANLINIANQIAVIAFIAIGMTMVIIGGGIDLSVGSLMALAAVLASYIIREAFDGIDAGLGGMILACAAAILACGLLGWCSGLLITWLDMPPFIVTLAMMLLARGAAERLSAQESINQVPASFVWLGTGADLAGIPNSVVCMFVLYLLAHAVMTRTVLGRHLYAVGGNVQAAHLAGVPVRRVLILSYVVCGMLAGLGGVITASKLRGGSPNYGQMYELYVIAAVVVGGTSLAGGEGNMIGTLLGAFLIAVIQNGMNLLHMESPIQKIVLGAVILGAVALDRWKRKWLRQ